MTSRHEQLHNGGATGEPLSVMVAPVEVEYAGKVYLVCSTPGTIPETKVVYVLDKEDQALLERSWWYNRKSGYVRSNHDYLHRIISPPPSREHRVDHINQWKLDNRRSVNLRPATQSQQSINTSERSRTIALPATGGLVADDIPTNIYYRAASNGKGEYFYVHVQRDSEEVFRCVFVVMLLHITASDNFCAFFRKSATSRQDASLQEKLDSAIDLLNGFKVAHPEHFPMTEEFTAEQLRTREEFDAILDKSGLNEADYAVFKTTTAPRRPQQTATAGPSVGFAHKKTQAKFQLLHDERGVPIAGVMTKDGHRFLYDYEDHDEISSLNWYVERKQKKEGPVTYRVYINIPSNLDKVRRLADFTGKDVSLEKFLYYKHHLQPEQEATIKHYSGNHWDVRQENLEEVPGSSRGNKGSGPPPEGVMQTLLETCHMTGLPKYVSIKNERTAWSFVIKLPWHENALATSRSATMSPKDKVRVLEQILTDEYATQGRSYVEENAVLTSIRSGFIDMMARAT